MWVVFVGGVGAQYQQLAKLLAYFVGCAPLTGMASLLSWPETGAVRSSDGHVRFYLTASWFDSNGRMRDLCWAPTGVAVPACGERAQGSSQSLHLVKLWVHNLTTPAQLQSFQGSGCTKKIKVCRPGQELAYGFLYVSYNSC